MTKRFEPSANLLPSRRVDSGDRRLRVVVCGADSVGASKLTDAELREASLASLAALKQLGPEIRWLHSFVCDDKIYCIYYAPDENTIRGASPWR